MALGSRRPSAVRLSSLRTPRTAALAVVAWSSLSARSASGATRWSLNERAPVVESGKAKDMAAAEMAVGAGQGARRGGQEGGAGQTAGAGAGKPLSVCQRRPASCPPSLRRPDQHQPASIALHAMGQQTLRTRTGAHDLPPTFDDDPHASMPAPTTTAAQPSAAAAGQEHEIVYGRTPSGEGASPQHPWSSPSFAQARADWPTCSLLPPPRSLCRARDALVVPSPRVADEPQELARPAHALFHGPAGVRTPRPPSPLLQPAFAPRERALPG